MRSCHCELVGGGIPSQCLHFFFQTTSIIWPLLSLWVAFNIKSSSVYRGNARHYYYFSLIWPPGYIYVRPNDSPTPTPSSSELSCDLRFHLIKDLGSSTVKSYPNPFLFFFLISKNAVMHGRGENRALPISTFCSV